MTVPLYAARPVVPGGGAMTATALSARRGRDYAGLVKTVGIAGVLERRLVSYGI